MGISIYNIAEQIRGIIGQSRAEYQEIIQQCKNAYAQVCFASWAKGKIDGVSEVAGSFMYTFQDLEPELDIISNQYYIIIPSSYVDIPHDMGINFVGFPKGQDKPFLRFPTGLTSVFAELKSEGMGGNQRFEVDGNKMYFPKMTKDNVGKIMLRLAVAFGDDSDEELNISPNTVNDIIAIVIPRLMNLPPVHPDTLIK
jgi:hypothetical protein